MNRKARVKAHSNIALIKYWGKKDDYLKLPMNSSLSMTLDCFYTITEVEFSKDLREDIFYLNDSLQDKKATEKISVFVDLFRQEAKTEDRVLIRSTNYLPTAAGLASSASGFAALAGALNEALDLKMDKKDLSRFARRGSGSATRSVYGGFVEWVEGEDNESSYARRVDPGDFDIGMVIVVLNPNKKKISSTKAMKETVESSPFYQIWPREANSNIIDMKKAIKDKDVKRIGEIAERNSIMMHATMMGAKDPIIYWEKDTMVAMDMVRQMRDEKIPAYFTMDAGPNVKIICRKSDQDQLVERLGQYFSDDQIIKAGIGPSISICEENL